MGLIPVSSTIYWLHLLRTRCNNWAEGSMAKRINCTLSNKENSSSEKKMRIVKVIDATQENAATSFPMILGADW